MRIICQLTLLIALSLNCRAQIVPILRNVFTTNTFDTDIVGGAIPYFDHPSGKFVATGTVYTNGFLFEPTLGTFSVFHTNITGDLMLVLQEGGPAGPSIQGYSDKFVVANTNLTFDAVGPFSIRLRVDGSNVLEAVAGSISLSGKTNQIGDNGTSLTYNRGSIFQSFYYGGQFGFTPDSIIPTNILASNLGSGDLDIFTVPAGKRFFPTASNLGTTNQTAATAYSVYKTNGVYYRQAGNLTNIKTNVLNQLPTTGINGYGFLFEENETVAINSTQVGGNVILSGLLFSTNSAFRTVKLLALTGGNDTLYTCPAGKCAVNMTLSNPGNAFGFANYVNDSGSARQVIMYFVPSGSSPGSSNIVINTSCSDKSSNPFAVGIMFPGDSIVFQSNAATATQWAWITVAEIPFP